MSLKSIVVEGCSLEFQNGGSPNDGIIITPQQTSSKVKAEGKAVYKTLKFSIAGYTASSDVNPNWVPGSGTGSGEISASAQKTKVEGYNVILEGDDSGEITINGMEQLPGSTTPTSAQVTEIVKVSDAGQNKVKGS